MKKKIIILLISAASLLACVFGLTACDDGVGWDHECNFVVTVVSPTCTEEGYKETKCTLCGYAYGLVLKPLGHDEVIDEGYPATCTEDGLTDGKHCFDCGEIIEPQVVIPKGHTAVTDEGYPATCTEDGLTDGSHCSECGETIVAQTAISAKGHTEEIIPAVEPTCTEDGYEEGSRCSECGSYIVPPVVVNAKGHTKVVDSAVAPTCIKSGLTEGSHCSKCGEILVEQIITPATGHAVDEYNHCSTCNNDIATEGLIYALNDDGQSYSVTGIGTATDKVIYIAREYDGKPVTRIGERAFANLNSVERVYMPVSVTSIEKEAFDSCYGLKSVTIPYSVKSIGEWAFGYCLNNLTSVTILGENVRIARWAFLACANLTSVTLPDSVESIGYDAFKNCGSLRYNNFDNGKYLGNSENPFVALIEVSDKNITSLTMHENTKIIAEKSIENCTNLNKLSIPDSIERIYDDALWKCDSIEYNSFGGADYLGNAENPYVMLVKASDKNLTSYTIHENTKLIYYHAFGDCKKFTRISVPASVKRIGGSIFEGCFMLTEITVDGGNKVYRSAGNSIIEIDSKTLVVGCSSSVIPSDGSVTSVGDYAFSECHNLETVVIPDTVTSIGVGAFRSCYKLSEVKLSATLKSIGVEAFFYCYALTRIEIPASVTNIGRNAFGCCFGVTDIVVNEENKVYHSSGNTVIETASNKLILGCQNSVVPADGSVTSIGEFAFFWCIKLANITLPDTVTRIEQYAFYECSSLTNIVLPSSVTFIGDFAFDGCKSLTTIDFDGKTAEWESIEKGTHWDLKTGDYTVKCSNGTLTKSGSKE